jgi:predicted nucleic acid-binding protein
MGDISDVYVDANILIYIVEGNKALASELKLIIEALDAGVLQAVTSELTLAEVLIRPLRNNDRDVVRTYKTLLTSSKVLRTVPLNATILERSASIRCNSMISLPDAIHLATAELAGCKYFLTEDRQLRVPAPLVVVGVLDMNALLLDWHQS